MKIRQKILCFLVIIVGVLFINIGKAQATSLSLSPNSGLAGSQFTISGSGFTPSLVVIVRWNSDGLDASVTSADESGNYSSSAQVPSGAPAGQHTVTVTSVSAGYGPKHNWIARIFPKAFAADGSASATFTVTAPAITPATPPAETPSTNNNTTTSDTQSNTNNTQPDTSSSPSKTQTTPNPSTGVTNPSESTTAPTAQNESNKESNKGVKMCHFPWWIWLLLVLITVVNLVLFLLRFWKKKSKQSV
jgi:hypothetical protein